MEAKVEPEVSENKKKSKVGPLLKGFLLMLFGMGFGYFILGGLLSSGLSSGVKFGLSLTQKILLIPAMIIPIFVVIAIHELGHLLTGLAQGFKFQLYIVGPLGIKRDEVTDQIKVYFNKELNLAGGLAATIPTREDPENIWKFARLIIAGPLTSLLFGGILLYIAPSFPGFTRLLIFIGGIFSLLIFLVTIFPAGSSTFMSDGKRFLRLLKPETRNIEMAIMRLGRVYAQTRTYDHLDVKDIELMKTDKASMLNTIAYFYGYLHYLSIGATEKAEKEAVIYQKKAQNFPRGFRTAMDKEISRVKAMIGNAAE